MNGLEQLVGQSPAQGGASQTVLFIHAHPDDESIATGATMAALATAGHRVMLLTCTRGELGEVIPTELAHLQVGTENSVDDGTQLSRVRLAELAEATAVLGVDSGFLLGTRPAADDRVGERIYRDSGMSWGADGRAQPAPNATPGSFTQVPIAETSAQVLALLRFVRPDVVITYDADGGYGHPDHIRAHDTTVEAVREYNRNGSTRLFVITNDADSAGFAVDGDFERKRAAIAAHKTQAVVEGDRFALSNGQWQDLKGREYFRPVSLERDHPTTGRRIWQVIVALLLGVVVCFLGTALHGQIAYVGETSVPWGAVVAVIFAFTTALSVGLWARAVWAAALTGAVAFSLNYLLASIGEVPLIITTAGAPFGLGVAGLIWTLGTGAGTVAAMLLVARNLRRTRVKN